jgi:hypothetical protein
MFKRLRRRTIQWRRVAQFEPVRVEGTAVAKEEASDRPSGAPAIQAGMRVVLRRETDSEHGPGIVAVVSLDERTLGYLTADVAAWVAPLLCSNRVAIDGRIVAVEQGGASVSTLPGFYVTLTQFEQRPVERFALTLAFAAVARAPIAGATWCAARTAALFQALTGATPGSARFDVRSSDHYATDDRSGN